MALVNLIELPTTRLICDKKIATAVPLSLQMTRPRKEIKAKLSVVYWSGPGIELEDLLLNLI